MYLIPKTAFEEDENLSSDAYFFDFEAKQQINNENFGLFFTRAWYEKFWIKNKISLNSILPAIY